MRIISPSLLSADFSCLEDQIRTVENAGANRLHLDIMDGHFVPNITFGPLVVQAVAKVSKSTLDVHLMIEQPHRYIKQFVEAGAHTVVVHAEASEDLRHDLSTIRELGATPGIAMNPDTPFDELTPYLNDLGYILIMSVFPGFGGQEFIEATLESMTKAVAAREKHHYLVAVDGGINTQTIDKVISTGIDIAVVGSALFHAPDITRRFQELRG
jgi:ribulose-phosphate 3-epimerase